VSAPANGSSVIAFSQVDRTELPATLTFVSYGVCVRLHAPDATWLTDMKQRLPPGWRLADGSQPDCTVSVEPRSAGYVGRVVWRDGEDVASTSVETRQHLPNLLESQIRLLVAEHAPRQVFVHAGVVGWGGIAIVVPGRTFTGKTTLVAELIRRGATYYSDEYAVFDVQGRVHPFAKPLSIREAGIWQQREWPVEELGGRAGKKPLTVGLIVATHFEAVARWHPRRLSAGEGVLALLNHTVSVRRQPKRALDVLGRVVAQAAVLEGVRGEARELIDEIVRNVHYRDACPGIE